MRASCAHKLRYCYLLQSKCFFPCLQPDTSSFLQLRELSSGWRIITNFSYKQRLQRFVAFEYGLHFFKNFHLMEDFTSASFRDQMCLLSSVQFLYLSCRNEVLWFAYLVLNFPSVNPT